NALRQRVEPVGEEAYRRNTSAAVFGNEQLDCSILVWRSLQAEVIAQYDTTVNPDTKPVHCEIEPLDTIKHNACPNTGRPLGLEVLRAECPGHRGRNGHSSDIDAFRIVHHTAHAADHTARKYAIATDGAQHGRREKLLLQRGRSKPARDRKAPRQSPGEPHCCSEFVIDR